MKSTAGQLALVGAPLQEDDLILHCLNGIGPEFNEISGAVRAREQPISLEALHGKLVEYEDFLNEILLKVASLLSQPISHKGMGPITTKMENLKTNRNNSAQQNQFQQPNQSRNENPNLVC